MGDRSNFEQGLKKKKKKKKLVEWFHLVMEHPQRLPNWISVISEDCLRHKLKLSFKEEY